GLFGVLAKVAAHVVPAIAEHF
uniref:Maculatin-1.1 n=1 Tax=Ranoidea genimaculata TaxID=95132 RepID=MCU11_RANGE|nr:RecName: Full=Maculatin-1.1; Contains: RecName: Full=Maculatin-1.1.1 [Ranoidea genimaculata]